MLRHPPTHPFCQRRDAEGFGESPVSSSSGTNRFVSLCLHVCGVSGWGRGQDQRQRQRQQSAAASAISGSVGNQRQLSGSATASASESASDSASVSAAASDPAPAPDPLSSSSPVISSSGSGSGATCFFFDLRTTLVPARMSCRALLSIRISISRWPHSKVTELTQYAARRRRARDVPIGHFCRWSMIRRPSAHFPGVAPRRPQPTTK